MYPRVLIDLSKFRNNVKVVNKRLNNVGIDIFGVSKVFCADKHLSKIFVEEGLAGIADSRISNLSKLKDYPIKKILLRIPMHSEIEDVIKYSDISLNSETSTLNMLSKEAIKQGKVHGIILMIDLGDLREGFFDKDELVKAAGQIVKLKGVNLVGIGTNLTCFGAIIPKMNHMCDLVRIKEKIETMYDISLKYISAGNSSSYYMTEEYDLPHEINNLRIGEIFVCGNETAFSERVEGARRDVFVLEAEIVELKKKPSVPIGESGVDAFGNKPVYSDKGDMIRAICAIGRQDVNVDSIIPFDKNIEIIGSSSDHIILNLTECDSKYKVGDIISFRLKYGGILSVMTSEYVEKVFIEE